MKFNRIKNCKTRTLFYKKEFLLLTYKFLKVNLLNTRISSQNKKTILNFIYLKKFFRVSVKNKCVFTGCNNSLNKNYNISRVYFRKLLQFGIIPNYHKAVW